MMANLATECKLHLYVRRMMVLSGLVVLVGCGSGSNSWPVADLQGEVTIGGKPIPSGAKARIMFIPPMSGDTSNQQPVIVPIVGGRYNAPDVPVGKLRVRFDIVRYTGGEGGEGERRQEHLVPENVQEGIPIEVSEGDRTRDFDL